MKATQRGAMLAEIFRDEPKFWATATVILGCVSFFKGLRFPNGWAATQALINYDHGLVKRGLFGATLGHWLHLEHYTRFALFSLLLLALFLILLCWMTVASGASGEIVTVFFASFTLTYLAHLVGYLDIPLGILTLALLLIRDPRLRFVAALPLCCIALLIHESFLLIFLPVILFSFAVDGVAAPKGKRRAEMWVTSGILAFVSLGVAMKLALVRPMTATSAEAMRQEYARRADFPIERFFFDVLRSSVVDNVRATKWALNRTGMKTFFVVSFAILLPTLILLAVAIAGMLRTVVDRRDRQLLSAAAIVAAGSPLVLSVLGWDWARWDSLACLQTFLVLLILCRSLPGGVELPVWFRNAGILAIALSMATGETLMDGLQVNPFPFMLHHKTNRIQSLRPLRISPPQP